MATYTQNDVADRLPVGWTFDDDAIHVTYEFDEYLDGVAFVTTIAQAAEAMNHHPDLLVSYREVTVELTSHDVGGVTDRDLELAGQIAAALGAAGGRIAD